MSQPVVYDIIREYLADQDAETPAYDISLDASPGWCLAVVRMGKPVTYSRKYARSIGDIVSGAFERKEKPLIISDECIQLNITRQGDSHLKTLNAILKSAKNNYLSANAILPNDWLFAWCHNNMEDTKSVIEDVLAGRPANDFMSGLKFVGRVNSIRKRTAIEGSNRTCTYTLQGVGFRELEAQFYYDVRMASMAFRNGENSLALYLSELNLQWTKIVGALQENSGNVKDNMGYLIPAFIDIVVGSGAKGAHIPSDPIEKGIENGQLVDDGPKGETNPKQLRDAPYAYMIPATVASILGRTVFDKSKGSQPTGPSVYGYSDILHLLIGVQEFSGETNDPTKGFWPVLNKEANSKNVPISEGNRSYCPEPVKGTYIPQEGDFINKPIWSILQQFLNQAINQMYTALRVTPDGSILPTITVRQIPYTTSAWPDTKGFPVTRFLDLPRWRLDPILVKYADIGRSDASHCNMVVLSPDASIYLAGFALDPSWQAAMNPAVYDAIDIGRSGIRSSMQNINCTITDAQRTTNGIRVWETLVADRMFGSQYTLNGQIVCKGIQSPIAECDNIELEGIVYAIESITDTCQITEKGKTFTTVLQVSMGMPADQSSGSEDFPRYPGFQVVKDPSKQSDEEYAKFAEDFTKQTGLEVPEKTDVTEDFKTMDDTTGYDEEMTSLDPQMNEDT